MLHIVIPCFGFILSIPIICLVIVEWLVIEKYKDEIFFYAATIIHFSVHIKSLLIIKIQHVFLIIKRNQNSTCFALCTEYYFVVRCEEYPNGQ